MTINLAKFKWFIFAYGQWMLFRSKKEFTDYAHVNPTIFRVKDLRPISEINSTIKAQPFVGSSIFEIIDNCAVPFDASDLIKPINPKDYVGLRIDSIDEVSSKWVGVSQYFND